MKHDKSLIERIEISDSFDLRYLPKAKYSSNNKERERERENVSFETKLRK